MIKTTFDRPIYAGNAIATVKSKETIKLMTIRGTAFEAYKGQTGNSNFIRLEKPKEIEKNKFMSKEESKKKGQTFHLPELLFLEEEE